MNNLYTMVGQISILLFITIKIVFYFLCLLKKFWKVFLIELVNQTKVKQDWKNQIIAKEFEQQYKTSRKSLPCVASEIKLTNLYLPASNYDNADLDASEYFFYVFVCKRHYSHSRTCLPLCLLLALIFCRSSLTSFN